MESVITLLPVNRATLFQQFHELFACYGLVVQRPFEYQDSAQVLVCTRGISQSAWLLLSVFPR